MGRRREPLPPVPLHKLSKQQRMVYSLAADHSTREISQILSIPEKQVRQIYSAIRTKSEEFANKNVLPFDGAEPARIHPGGSTVHSGWDDFKEMMENNGYIHYTSSELFIMEHVKKGISIREISRLTGKSIQSVRKTHQRAKKKLRCKDGFFDDNCITKVDTDNTYIKINPGLITAAVSENGPTLELAAQKTGISLERLKEMESCGILSFRELFKLIKQLQFNPYGPTERDELLKKIKDSHWVGLIRESDQGLEGRSSYGDRRKRAKRDKLRYLNRVIYYGTARRRYDGTGGDRPIIEDGRNGIFPLSLTREQLSQCGWLLKTLMLRPVYTYRHPGVTKEISRTDKLLSEVMDRSSAEKIKRELLFLKEDILTEDGRSIFLISRSQLLEISRALYGP